MEDLSIVIHPICPKCKKQFGIKYTGVVGCATPICDCYPEMALYSLGNPSSGGLVWYKDFTPADLPKIDGWNEETEETKAWTRAVLGPALGWEHS